MTNHRRGNGKKKSDQIEGIDPGLRKEVGLSQLTDLKKREGSGVLNKGNMMSDVMWK